MQEMQRSKCLMSNYGPCTSNAPAISAVADEGGPYAFTGTNFEISVFGGDSVITNGTHVKTIRMCSRFG